MVYKLLICVPWETNLSTKAQLFFCGSFRLQSYRFHPFSSYLHQHLSPSLSMWLIHTFIRPAVNSHSDFFKLAFIKVCSLCPKVYGSDKGPSQTHHFRVIQQHFAQPTSVLMLSVFNPHFLFFSKTLATPDLDYIIRQYLALYRTTKLELSSPTIWGYSQ